MSNFDVRSHNRKAWDREVREGNEWTLPVSSEAIAAARDGDWSVVLTPKKPVPKAWFGDLAGKRVLGLASAGGQQCPLFAAAGAKVTLIDNSPGQLDRDRQVAERDGLEIECVLGDMAVLDRFADGSFDLVFHPVSNCFVPDIAPVWREAYRVLAPGGRLLSGFCNPIMYVFDDAKLSAGELVARHAVPYSDMTSLTEEERDELVAAEEPLNFGHTLADQIGGQTDAGFAITGFYEDYWGDDSVLDRFFPSFGATLAVKIP